MAGFAVVMTFLGYVFFGLIAASIASLCLYLFAKRGFPEAGEVRRRVIIASVLAPFLVFLWPIAAFVIHVQISNRLAHQDCGLGLSPDPYVTLPNGYVLGSANTYDGYFTAPGFHTDIPVAGPGYVRSIVNLKYADGYFTGTQFNFRTSKTRGFLFDTRDRTFHVTDPDVQVRDWSATDPPADAHSYWVLYAQYRHS